MPTTLTAQADRARQGRASALVYLLELTLWRDKFGASPTSQTFYLSDLPRTVEGRDYLPLIADWGQAGDALGLLDSAVTIGHLDITLSNARPIGTRARFSDLIRHGRNNDTGTWDLPFADATLKLLFSGGTASDEIKLFRFLVEEATDVTEDTLTLRMTGVELGLADVDDLLRVDVLTFPAADPDAVGRIVPVPFGVLRGEPVLGLVAGLVDRLSADITATSPATGGSLALSDSDIVSRLPVPGTLQVDDEQIPYTSKNPAAASVGGITRHANGTIAATHNRGAAAFQVLSAYKYVIGQNRGAHKIKAVTAVYVDGAKAAPSSYVVNLSDTTTWPGFDVAVLTFTVKPIIKKQVTLAVADTIAVVDTIAVQDPVTVDDNIQISTSSRSYEVYRTNRALPAGSGGSPTNQSLDMPGLIGSGGVVEHVDWELQIGGSGSFNLTIITPNGALAFSNYTAPITFTFGGDAGQGFGTYGNCSFNTTFTNISVIAFSATVRRTVVLAKSGAAQKHGTVSKTGGASKTGGVTMSGNSSADTVIGQVTVDYEGLKDDGSGTITGTPNTRLEVPRDVIRCLMRELWRETDAALYGSASWAATRARQVADGYRWAMAFTDAKFPEFQRQIGLQARCELYQDNGLWELVFLDAKTTSFTLDGRNILGEVVIGWTPRTDLVTALTVQYDYDGVKQAWRGSAIKATTAQQSRWGSRRGRLHNILPTTVADVAGTAGVRDLLLTYVRDAATASRLGDWWLQQWQTERMTLKATTVWEAIGVQKGDAIAASVPLLDAYYNPMNFIVRGRRYNLDDGTIELEAREGDPAPLTVPLFGSYYAFSSAVESREGQYRANQIRTKTKAGRMAAIVGRSNAPMGAYRARLIGVPTKAGQYAANVTTTPHTITKSGTYKPVTRKQLAGAYAAKAAWDGAGYTWDDGVLTWDI